MGSELKRAVRCGLDQTRIPAHCGNTSALYRARSGGGRGRDIGAPRIDCATAARARKSDVTSASTRVIMSRALFIAAASAAARASPMSTVACTTTKIRTGRRMASKSARAGRPRWICAETGPWVALEAISTTPVAAPVRWHTNYAKRNPVSGFFQDFRLSPIGRRERSDNQPRGVRRRQSGAHLKFN